MTKKNFNDKFISEYQSFLEELEKEKEKEKIMISDYMLKKWERLAKSATPAPWYTCEDEPSTIFSSENDCNCYEVASFVESEDIEFIIAARVAVPALIAEVRELKKKIRDMEKEQEWNKEYIWKKF